MDEITDDRPPFPRTRWALLWIVAFALLQILLGTTAVLLAFPEIDSVQSLLAILGNLEKSGPASLYGTAVAGLCLTGALGFYLARDDRFRVIGLDSWGRIGLAKSLGAGLVILLSAAALAHLYSTYVISGSPLQAQTQRIIASMSDSWLDQVTMFFVIVIFAAIIEEILFRGLLQNGLKRRVGAGWAIVIAGLVFAAIHGQLLAFPVLALIGMAFGLLYHLTGSLRLTILLHMINNGAALAFS